MKCPCCKGFNNLKMWNGYLKCVREHLFNVESTDGRRYAVVVKATGEGCRVDDRFEVPENDEFT